jgi:hypothetical protein
MRSLARLALCAGVLALVGFTTPQPVHAVCSSGGTVANVNDCVPGGVGGQDCRLEWSITPQPGIDPGTGFPAGKFDCLDNDPSCDADTTPGQCTFFVRPCVNVNDPRLTCGLSDATTYLIKKPGVSDALKAHKDRNMRNNRRAYDLALGSLIPTNVINACGDEQKIVVALTKGGTKKGIGRAMIKVTDTMSNTDLDTLKFVCMPNPNIATIPCASARQIASTSELIGGPLAMGKVGDWLIENDKARFIVRDLGREFSFMLTYGGHLIDADFQQKLGPSSLSPPYPPGRDSFQAISPLIHISSSDNPTSILVVNDGTAGGPAKLRTVGPDDLFDPIDPRIAIKGFSPSLGVPPWAIDVNLPVSISTDYTLKCGDDFVEMETTINNSSGSALDLYVGDFANGSGQLEMVGTGVGFGEAAIRLGDGDNVGAPGHYDYMGWFGFGQADLLSYAVIPQNNLRTSSFASSGVVVPVYGNSLLKVLLGSDAGKQIGSLHVPANGSNSFKRWFAVSNNGMGRVVDARNTLVARGDITPTFKTGYIQGVVTVGGQPVDGARVVVYRKPGDRSAQRGLVDAFETRDGGFYQGSLPMGEYYVAAKVAGHMYEGGFTFPHDRAITIGGGTTIADFAIPTTGYVRVTAVDGTNSQPIASKVSVVGLSALFESETDIKEALPSGSFLVGNLFGYDAREKVSIYGLPQVHFTDLGGDTGTFAIQPGTYQIVVSHGPRYSVFKQMITVVPGTEASPQVVNASVVPVVTTTGFVSGDFHVHMLESPDSVISNRERIVTMLAEGVDYFVASDHDYVTDLTADVAALGASSKVKTALSQEITYFDSGHFGAYPLDPANLPDPTSSTGGALDWGDATSPIGLGYPSDGAYDLSPEQMALLAKGPPYNAIVVQANHFNSGTLGYFRVHGIDTTVVPPQSDADPALLRLDPSITNSYTDEITALELWIENSRSQSALALGENLGDWFNMLNNWSSVPGHEKLRKTATFDSDTHSTTVVQAGGPRNMVADTSGSVAAIDPVTVANRINEGRNVGTNGPFVQVSIVGDSGATAAHAIGSPLLVPALLGTADIHIDIASPDWAEFDQVQIFVNTVPSCVTSSPNFVNSVKQVCTATPTFVLNKGADFAVTPVGVNGSTRLEAHIIKTLTGGSLPAGDAWVVVVVKGTDGVSKPLFPMAPTSILAKNCVGEPCTSCTANSECFFGSCLAANLTTADLADGNLGQCGMTSLAIANPLFIDRDANGSYKGLTIP